MNQLKQIFLFAIISISFSYQAIGQVNLGLRFSPALQMGRFEDPDKPGSDISGVGLRPTMGIIADFPIGTHYYFSTGFNYLSKRVKFDSFDQEINFTKNYSLQYLQVPLTLKLYTNEIALDKRLYFQAGGVTEILIHTNRRDELPMGITRFLPFDIGMLLSAGIEQNLGVNTSYFIGFSYQRGLFNVVNRNNFTGSELSIKNDLFTLEFGIMF
jgi:hypothetical protein